MEVIGEGSVVMQTAVPDRFVPAHDLQSSALDRPVSAKVKGWDQDGDMDGGGFFNGGAFGGRRGPQALHAWVTARLATRPSR